MDGWKEGRKKQERNRSVNPKYPFICNAACKTHWGFSLMRI
jgi:hypothetical protein